MLRAVPSHHQSHRRHGGQQGEGLHASPQTAPPVIEALRLYARVQTGAPAKYKVEKWDRRDAHVERSWPRQA
jgi:hypothetical protein